MIRLCYSNRVEALVDALAENVARTRGSLFEPIRLVVPNALVGHTVKQGLARRLGIAAHVQDGFLQRFLRDVAEATTPGTKIVDRDLVEGELLALFHDPRRLASRDLHDVRVYLDVEGSPHEGREAEGIDRRRVQLAGQIATLFDEYAFSRPEMLAAWQAGKLVPEVDEPLQLWQRALWLGLFDRRHGELTKREAVTLPHFFANTPVGQLRVDPPTAHIFGLSYVARLYRSIFAALSNACALHIYALNPCREFWEDLEPKRRKSPDRRFPKRRQKEQLSLFSTQAVGVGVFVGVDGHENEHADAHGDDHENDNPLLRLWARPGRDNIRLLNQLSECDFDGRFEDPLATAPRPSLLARLQQGILDREPFLPDHTPHTSDGSLVLWPCPSPRRELEAIAGEIWSLVRDDEARERRGEPGRPLRFSDFAVIVPAAAAATYLPLAHAVFHEASELPHTVFDLAPAAESGIGEAIELLLALPNSPLGRPDLLRLVMHPTVARRFPDVDPEDWLALCEELEIVQGADRSDHVGSYLERDRVSWNQGLGRLALGAFLSGRRSGEDRSFELGGEPVLPGDLTAGAEPAARALGMLARELIDFARSARSAPAPLIELLALLRQTIAATISPATPQEQAALGDCFAVLERLTESAPPGLVVNFRIAADLVRTRLQLGSRGLARRAPEGVTVASFVPMRALPFRVIFVAGLDERVFPTSKGYTALDLRAAAREPGDVTPREQDEYMFLETLLSARERMYLSFVARDSVTGDPRGPSSTVVALMSVLGGDPSDPGAAIRREVPPLWRHEDVATCAVIPAATRERAAHALGRSLRQAAGGLIQLPALGDLRPALAPETWAAIAPGLGGRDPITATDLAARPQREPRRSLTFSDLRRFLECPLQGAVRVLLPIRDDDEAADDAESALREHEQLDEVRRDTVPFLRDLFCDAAGAGRTDDAALAAAYDSAAELARLDGTLADGLFGKAARARHQMTLRTWRDGLNGALAGTAPEGLAPLWFGAAPEHRRDVDIKPAIALDLLSADGPLPISLGGRTEPVARTGDGNLTVTLASSAFSSYQDKDLLGAWFTHLALAAGGLAEGPTRVLLVRPGRYGAKPSVQDVVLSPISGDEARTHLANLAGELLRGVHAYFFPYEAIFSWREKKQSRSVRDSILLLRDDGFTRFASERGPVPEPKSYPVPNDETADAMVARRFKPFFDRLVRVSRKGDPS